MNTQIQQDELELPTGRIYFDDIIKTDEFGLFQNLDALLLWASKNPNDVSGYSGRTFLRSYRTARGNLAVVYVCEDIDECDCSWQEAMRIHGNAVRSMKDKGRTDFPDEPDFDTTPRQQVHCEYEVEIEYSYVELGVVVK
jgi:hypothetical protein